MTRLIFRAIYWFVSHFGVDSPIPDAWRRRFNLWRFRAVIISHTHGQVRPYSGDPLEILESAWIGFGRRDRYDREIKKWIYGVGLVRPWSKEEHITLRLNHLKIESANGVYLLTPPLTCYRETLPLAGPAVTIGIVNSSPRVMPQGAKRHFFDVSAEGSVKLIGDHYAGGTHEECSITLNFKSLPSTKSPAGAEELRLPLDSSLFHSRPLDALPDERVIIRRLEWKTYPTGTPRLIRLYGRPEWTTHGTLGVYHDNPGTFEKASEK